MNCLSKLGKGNTRCLFFHVLFLFVLFFSYAIYLNEEECASIHAPHSSITFQICAFASLSSRLLLALATSLGIDPMGILLWWRCSAAMCLGVEFGDEEDDDRPGVEMG